MSRFASVRPAAVAGSIVVGALAGVVAAQVRLHLGLPGHKILVWLTPVVAARLLLRCPAGATLGAAAAGGTALAFGGHLAGGALLLPLLPLAGGIVDFAVALAERMKASAWLTVPLLAPAGCLAGLLCAARRFLTSKPNWHVLLGLSEPASSVASYALFGLAACVLGATIAAAAATLARRAIDRPAE